MLFFHFCPTIQLFKCKSVIERQIPTPTSIGIYNKKDLGERLKAEGITGMLEIKA
jgi:hypothetical protein